MSPPRLLATLAQKFFCSLTPVNAEPSAPGSPSVQAQSGSSSGGRLPNLARSPSLGPNGLPAPGDGTLVLGAHPAPPEEQDIAPLIMSAPVPLCSRVGPSGASIGPPKTLKLTKRGIFTTAIGAPGKKTLARWHLPSPAGVISVLATMADLEKPDAPLPEGEAEGAEPSEGAEGSKSQKTGEGA